MRALQYMYAGYNTCTHLLPGVPAGVREHGDLVDDRVVRIEAVALLHLLLDAGRHEPQVLGLEQQ